MQIITILPNKLSIKSLQHPNINSYNRAEKIKEHKSLDVQVKGSMARNVGVTYICIGALLWPLVIQDWRKASKERDMFWRCQCLFFIHTAVVKQ